MHRLRHALIALAPALSLLTVSSAGWAQGATRDSVAMPEEIHGVRSDVVSHDNLLGGKLDVLSNKLDLLHSDMQALLKAMKTGSPTQTTTTSTASGGSANTASASDAITAKFFPPDAGLAVFPSPENARVVRVRTVISGRPYLLDNTGAVHQLVPVSASAPTGYVVNGRSPNNNTDPDSVYMLLLERQGQVYGQRAGGQWQHFNPGTGGMYNAGLPDAFQTDASGQTTSTVASSSVTAPTQTARQSPAPGTSGKILTVGAGKAFPTISAAITAAMAGDTVDISAGVYKEAPPAWTVPLKVVFEQGASLNLTGLTGKLARGKGALVPAADSIIVNPVITGVAMDQKVAQSTAAIRPDVGTGYLDIQGGSISGNQNGIAGGGVPVVLTMENTKLFNNGLGDGYTHNMYMSGGTLSVTLTNVQSTDPNGGHAIKSRAFLTKVIGGSFDAFSAAAIDIPNGSATQAVIDGATITKKAGAYNHAVVDYATEDKSSGNGGLLISHSTLNLLCDNPFLNIGAGSIVTIEDMKLNGTKPSVQGGTVKGL